MTFVVDTNVLVYASNRDCREHAACRGLLEQWRSGQEPWYATWSIVHEYLRVSTHPRVFDRPLDIGEGWSFVQALFDCPSFSVLRSTERHREIAALVFEELPDLNGNLVHDAHTAILMREHGVRRIYTRDTDFHRFPKLEVLDPLRAMR